MLFGRPGQHQLTLTTASPASSSPLFAHLIHTWEWTHALQGHDFFQRDAYMVIIEFMGLVLCLTPDDYLKSEPQAARA